MSEVLLNPEAGIPLRYMSRHGLITGPTGNGKSVTLMRLVEQLSAKGVPTFVIDAKGDLSALERSCPVTVLDLLGNRGKPVSVPLSAMGATLVARALELTDAQSGVVEAAFAAPGPMNTIKDFHHKLALLSSGTRHAGRYAFMYGHVTAASLGVVARALNRLAAQAGHFFDGVAWDVADLLDRSNVAPVGKVTILAADGLIQAPRLYGAFLLWLLNELFSRLPEVGDLVKPRLVLFFDEAHLLFRSCPPPLLGEIEQTIRMFRSKGVGIYFVSQSKDDIPYLIRAQLGTTIEHRFGIGRALLSTLTPSGQLGEAVNIPIDLPRCPLGAVEIRPVEPMAQPSLPTDRPWRPLAYGFLTLLAAPAAWIAMSTYNATGRPSLAACAVFAAALATFGKIAS